jgi:hypothetical protein
VSVDNYIESCDKIVRKPAVYNYVIHWNTSVHKVPDGLL